MKELFKSVMAFSLAALIGCVIIPSTFEANIRIEIRHIQEQAGGVLDYVEGTSDELPGLDAPSASQTPSIPARGPPPRSPRAAYAAALDVQTPPRTRQARPPRRRVRWRWCGRPADGQSNGRPR